MTGFVYAIASDAKPDRVKIGWSKDPFRRKSNLQIGNSERLKILGIVEATKDEESELHSRLRPWRIVGEWFKIEGGVKLFLEKLPPVSDNRSITNGMEPARSIIAKLGGHAEVSQATETSLTTSYRWCAPREQGGTDGVIPRWHHAKLLKLAEEKNVSLSVRDFYPPIEVTL